MPCNSIVAAFIINKEGESATEKGGDRVKKETWFRHMIFILIYEVQSIISPF